MVHRSCVGLIVFVLGIPTAYGWQSYPIPIRQSQLTTPPPETQPIQLRDSSRDDRWLGLEVRDLRWAPDSSALYFRWNMEPRPQDDPDADPWFRFEPGGDQVQLVPQDQVHAVPAPELEWNREGNRAAWITEGRLYLFEKNGGTRLIYSARRPARNARFSHAGTSLRFLIDDDLFEYGLAEGGLRQLTRRRDPEQKPEGAASFLKEQQLELFELMRRRKEREDRAAERSRRVDPSMPQVLTLDEKIKVDDLQLSPDDRFLTVRWRREAPAKPTVYLDFATRSGYAQAERARPKVGEEQDEFGMYIVAFDPPADPETVELRPVVSAESEGHSTIIYGPYFNPEGDKAVVQIVSQGHKDRWISRLDLESARTTVVTHDHDDAWLGGPEPLAGYLRPVLLKWLPGGRFVFASERSGWSHLYLAEPEGTTLPLTQGEWEVREAQLTRDRSFWLIRSSREHPCDDHLYRLPAAGGTLQRLTKGEGRHQGWVSPDGAWLARFYGNSVHLPDLYVEKIGDSEASRRVTVSGTDNFFRHELVRPRVVSFTHPDGKPVWGMLFEPEDPLPERAAILHIHGGGYRQFSHRGWSVYGYSMHLGFINSLVGQGYYVLDFDYRGGAGFGRDYRTDIYRSMGVKDVEGALSAIDYLVSEHGVDRDRVGIYGISYGGFFTLMSLFKHPGVFAAGIANAAVADWAHYNHVWTSRVLNLPESDPEAFRVSSPIHHAGGLEDPLLIVHGLIDDNVQFQDAARLVQKLIEEEKDFEVMFYPTERHVIEEEPSRFDYVRRAAQFFEKHLLRR